MRQTDRLTDHVGEKCVSGGEIVCAERCDFGYKIMFINIHKSFRKTLAMCKKILEIQLYIVFVDVSRTTRSIFKK